MSLEPAPRARAALRRVTALRAAANRLDEAIAGRTLARMDPDLVWCNTVLSASYVRPALARGIPVVLHVHELGRLVPGVLRRYGLTGRDGSAAIRSPGLRLVAASDEARAEVALAATCDIERVDLLESSIDTDEVRAAAAAGVATYRARWGGPIVGACGHATDRKGIDLWLQIARRVHDRRPDTAFVWVGLDGSRHQAAAAELGLDGVVRFTGEVPDAAAAIAAFDVFTLPSRHDTFALVVLEAMALARPCVAFDAGGARRQLGDTGVVVPPHELDAFADAVIGLLADPERRAQLGVRAQQSVDAHFGRRPFGRAVGRLAAAGQDPLAGRRGSPPDTSGPQPLQ